MLSDTIVETIGDLFETVQSFYGANHNNCCYYDFTCFDNSFCCFLQEKKGIRKKPAEACRGVKNLACFKLAFIFLTLYLRTSIFSFYKSKKVYNFKLGLICLAPAPSELRRLLTSFERQRFEVISAKPSRR